MTNTALTAGMQLILAAVNQFAERAELNVALPIREQSITQVRGCGELHRSTIFVVEGRHRFGWLMTDELRGRITSYDDLMFSTVRIDRDIVLPSLTNAASIIGTNEALAIASRCMRRLGYDKLGHYRSPPIVAQFTHQINETDIPKPVPLFGIRWLPKNDDAWQPYVFEIEVSGITKKITRFGQLTSEGTIVDLRPFLTNSPPKLGVIATNAPLALPHSPQDGSP